MEMYKALMFAYVADVKFMELELYPVRKGQLRRRKVKEQYVMPPR